MECKAGSGTPLASYPGLLTPAFVACSTNVGTNTGREGLGTRLELHCVNDAEEVGNEIESKQYFLVVVTEMQAVVIEMK